MCGEIILKINFLRFIRVLVKKPSRRSSGDVMFICYLTTQELYETRRSISIKKPTGKYVNIYHVAKGNKRQGGNFIGCFFVMVYFDIIALHKSKMKMIETDK